MVTTSWYENHLLKTEASLILVFKMQGYIKRASVRLQEH